MIIIDAAEQQSLGLGVCGLIIAALVVELGLYRVKENSIQDGGLLAWKHLTPTSRVARESGRGKSNQIRFTFSRTGPWGLGDDLMGSTIRARSALAAVACSVAVLAATDITLADVPGGCDTPISQRTSEVGCYLLATEVLGAIPERPVFWHLYSYPTRAAAEAVKRPQGTVVEPFGKVWLYTIAGAGWVPSGGEFIAIIGPLPITAGKQYTARYMEAVVSSSMQTSIHRHSGPDAWYVVTGMQCLETPQGITTVRAGEGAAVPDGSPIVLSSVGSETLRTVLLALHDTSQRWSTMASDWEPKGLCPK
jgi:mannose-6-phosphate isomerase-like protein (cupin superfamily)